ncbi:MAG: DNA repair protein RecO [Chloroflexota bacterium]
MASVSSPQVYRTEAIILRHQRYGEAGRLVTIFSPNHGKLRALARGALRPTSHLAGHLEPLTKVMLLLARARGFDLITQAETLESHQAVRSTLWRMSAAFYAAELVERMSQDNVESFPIYRLLQRFLVWLEEANEPDVPVRFFELQLLGVSGYRPELRACAECGAPLEPVLNGFSAPAGGCLCPACTLASSDVRPISVNALKVLRVLQLGDIELAGRLRRDAPLARELDQLMRYYMPHAVDHELRTTGFVDAVRATRPTGIHAGPMATAPRSVDAQPDGQLPVEAAAP